MGAAMVGIPGKKMKRSAKFFFAMAGIVLLMFFSLVVWVGWFWSPAYPLREFMSTEKVCQRWGRHPLDTEKFKAAGRSADRAADEAVRAEMACSLLENQDEHLGKDRLEIIDIFGYPDGWFITEYDPAYFINDADRTDQDVWQIVFLLRRGEVSEIVVHKNCCRSVAPESVY